MHKDIEEKIVRLNEQLSRVRPDDTFSKMLLTGKIKEQYHQALKDTTNDR